MDESLIAGIINHILFKRPTATESYQQLISNLPFKSIEKQQPGSMTRIRCAECQTKVLEFDYWDEWRSLFDFVSHLLDEEQITEATYHRQINHLMAFKRYAEDKTNGEKENLEAQVKALQDERNSLIDRIDDLERRFGTYS
jgi:hypothetical protein